MKRFKIVTSGHINQEPRRVITFKAPFIPLHNSKSSFASTSNPASLGVMFLSITPVNAAATPVPTNPALKSIGPISMIQCSGSLDLASEYWPAGDYNVDGYFVYLTDEDAPAHVETPIPDEEG